MTWKQTFSDNMNGDNEAKAFATMALVPIGFLALIFVLILLDNISTWLSVAAILYLVLRLIRYVFARETK